MICSRCLMDDSVEDISYDKNGVCCFCKNAEEKLNKFNFNKSKNLLFIENILKKIKSKHNKKYDCIIGISGGLDSSYVAHYVVTELKLNPLAIHFDNGWNSNLAISNIQKIISNLKIDLETVVVRWDEFSTMQKAFIKSDVKNAEIPTDHGIQASLFEFAKKMNIEYIIGGGNLQTESIMPDSWSEDPKDLRLINDVLKKHNSSFPKSMPKMGYKHLFFYTLLFRKKYISILNYLDYDKKTAEELLMQRYNWEPYKIKHGESLYTEFFQEVYLPRKFGIEKKKAHLSSLIINNQITKEEALEKLKIKISNDRTKFLIQYVSKKLNFKNDELEQLMLKKDKRKNYKNSQWILKKYPKLINLLRQILTKA